MLEHFYEIQARLADSVQLEFKRYLFDAVDWQARMFALIGPRGVGKTTMMLQHYKEEYRDPGKCLYVSADNIRVQAVGLYHIAGEFFKTGGRLLLVDEVHKYPGWAMELKNIYDSFPAGRTAVSGSSTLEILKGGHDLSRRLQSYRLPGLSFREFLALQTGCLVGPLSLEELVTGHTEAAAQIIKGAGGTILGHFRDYLDWGCYPFYLEGKDSYHVKLGNVVEKILSDDIPAVFGVRPTSVPVLRKLLHLVATSQPFAPNIERMAGNLGISKEYVYNFLDYLRLAGLFAFLSRPEGGFKSVRKPRKVYLDNPNLFRTLLGRSEAAPRVGAIRESFFLNQVHSACGVTADSQVDFATSQGYRFEVGGRAKSEEQLGDAGNAYLAVADTEIGSFRRIPLWLFGFLY